MRGLGALIGVSAVLLNCASAFGQSGSGDRFFPNEGDSQYNALHYDVRLAYAPGSGELWARATIEAVPVEPLSKFSIDLDGLQVTRVNVNGERAHFSRGHHKILVVPPAPLQAGSRFSVDIRYLGHPGARFEPGSFDGWLRTKDGAAAVGESNGTPTWLPCNNALADKASFDFHVTVPAELKAIANGRFVSVSKNGSRKTFYWREDEPMDAYLAVIDIGRGKLTRGKAVGVPTWTLVDPRLAVKWRRRIAEVPAILRFESKVFGRYPFDAAGSIVDRIGFDDALETQTRPIYDLPPWRVVLVHELAHQWFGDSVGLRAWPDIWLNEGFATWAQWFYNERHGGPPVRQVFERLKRARPSSGFWNPPPALLREPRELFSTSVYTRGAMALEALRLKVGTSTMLTILRDWTTAHRYGSADTTEFMALAEEVSGRPLQPLFERWLFSSGKPS
jgi:aminopeptidase N